MCVIFSPVMRTVTPAPRLGSPLTVTVEVMPVVLLSGIATDVEFVCELVTGFDAVAFRLNGVAEQACAVLALAEMDGAVANTTGTALDPAVHPEEVTMQV